jgi:peptidoglycan/LPS O-acetylase OafA/YrhL
MFSVSPPKKTTVLSTGFNCQTSIFDQSGEIFFLQTNDRIVHCHISSYNHRSIQQLTTMATPSPLRRYLSLGARPGGIPELDGIRALAIIMVLLYHFGQAYRNLYGSYFRQVIPEPLVNVFNNGWLGVDLFFVLSGFLIMRHLLKQPEPPNRNRLRVFFLKRMLRTFPLYYAIILLIVLGVLPSAFQQLTVQELMIHVFFLQDYLGTQILVPLWSLATEEKFYLLSPLLAALLMRKTAKTGIIIVLFVMAVLVLLRTWMMTQDTTPHHYEAFFWQFRAPFHFAVLGILAGVMVAWLSSRTQHQPHPLLVWTSVLTSVVIFTTIDTLSTSNVQVLNGLHLWMTFNFMVWVWAARSCSGHRWMTWLTGRSLRIIAVLSYALYLVHNTVFPWVYQLHKKWVLSETAWFHALTFFAIYLAISILISLVLHYLVEKPFLRLKDRL